MKIYGDLISPFVRMTLVAAHEVGLGDKVQQVTEAVKPTEVNAKLASLSPIGKIPVLETDHGHGVYDSRVIIEYLAHTAGNTNLIPHEPAKRFRVLWMARTETRLHATFDELEANWMDLLQDVNAGSVAVAVTLAYIDFRLPTLNWRNGHPKLGHWHEHFSGRDSMKKTALVAK